MRPSRALPARGSRIVAFAVAIILVVIFDQVTKAAARAALAGGHGFALIPGLVDLRLVKNTGAAFSLGEGAGLLFALFAVAAVILGAWVVATRDDVSMPLAIAIGCICGGGVGNMIDRLFEGSVTDFLSLAFVRFPVFNVADIFVTCGVAAMLVILFTEGRRAEPRG